MDVSVVIPSRNRAKLLREAIESILAQEHQSYEILVINDGSDGDEAAQYVQIAQDYAPRLRMHDLEATTTGHGQSYGINIGVGLAKGRYVTFLDDDDFWTDPHHLSRSMAVIHNAEEPPQLVYSDQLAMKEGAPVTVPVWLDGIDVDPAIVGKPIGNTEGRYYTVDELMKTDRFGHLNVSLVDRDLFLRIGGMDNDIRYECDRDFYLRCVDEAGGAAHIPVVVSQHNVPNQNRSDNMSTMVSDMQKAIYQLYVFDKAILFSKHPSVTSRGLKSKEFVLKTITRQLSRAGRHREAAAYARQAMAAGFGIAWLGHAIWLTLKARLNP